MAMRSDAGWAGTASQETARQLLEYHGGMYPKNFEVVVMVRKFCLCGLLGLLCSSITPSLALEPRPSYVPLPSYSSIPPEIEVLTDPSRRSKDPQAVTSATVSDISLTTPSFWWMRDQLDKNKKLVSNWVAYPKQKYVDILVNPQLWSNLDEGFRYSFINRYGIVASRKGYNVRIFNWRFSKEKPIAAYTCTPDPAAYRCRIQWQENNQRILNVSTLGR
jgi:hypothetical protein